jgi:hypothetical protein
MVALRSYTSNVCLPDGKVEVNVEYQGTTSCEELYAVADEYDALLGRIWIHLLGISRQEIDSEELLNSRASEIT